MKALVKRLSRLEDSHAAQRNKQGLTPAEVLRERFCRLEAKETDRPYEELLRESIAESKAFFKSYTGDRSIAGILRSHFERHAMPALENEE